MLTIWQVRFFGQQGGNLADFIRISAARASDTAGWRAVSLTCLLLPQRNHFQD
jgi:hypothetical protein